MYFLHALVKLWHGDVMSSYLLAICIDSLVNRVQSCGYGCYVRHICVNVLLLILLLLVTHRRSAANRLGVAGCRHISLPHIGQKDLRCCSIVDFIDGARVNAVTCITYRCQC